MKNIVHFLWFILVLGSMALLSWYKLTPGEQVILSSEFPKSAGELRSKDFPTLLVFIHPECPCSYATLDELERITPQIKDRINIKIVFKLSDDFNAKSISSHQTWKRALKVQGAQLVKDEHHFNEVFQVKTSGQTFLYDRFGMKVFQGGLTPMRGHRGETNATRFVTDWVQQQARVRSFSSLVYGCEMQEKHL